MYMYSTVSRLSAIGTFDRMTSVPPINFINFRKLGMTTTFVGLGFSHYVK